MTAKDFNVSEYLKQLIAKAWHEHRARGAFRPKERRS